MANKQNGTTIKAFFSLKKETKGAVAFEECSPEGKLIESADAYAVGTIYIRKHKLGVTIPKLISVEITY